MGQWTRAAILAGGRATRMGGLSKGFLLVDGQPILDRQIAALRPLFAPGRIAAVLAAGTRAADEEPYVVRGLEIVRDEVSGRGPLAGVAAALAWAGGELLFALACDMPHVDPRVVGMIVARARSSGADIALPSAGGRHQPLFACYSARCAPVIAGELEAGRLRASALPDAARAAGLVVDVIDEREIRTIDPDLRSFANFNRPGDTI